MSEKTNPSIKTLTLLILFVAAALSFSCGSSSGSSKSQVNPHAEAHKQMHEEFYREEQARDRDKALESIAGSFSGNLPCGDCEGIQFELKLNADQTYTSTTEYLGKPGTPVTEEGTYSLGTDGLIELNDSDSQMIYFRIEGELLRILDRNGKVIPGDLGALYLLRRETK